MPIVVNSAENSGHRMPIDVQVNLESNIRLRSQDYVDEQHSANGQEAQGSVLGNSEETDIDVNPRAEAQECDIEIQSAPNIPQTHSGSLHMSSVSPRSTPSSVDHTGDQHVYHQAKTNTEQSEKLPLPDPGGTLTPHQRSLHTRQSNSDLTTVTTASKPTQNKPAANKVLGPETKQELPKETASKKLPK